MRRWPIRPSRRGRRAGGRAAFRFAADFGKFIAEKWGKVIHEAGIMVMPIRRRDFLRCLQAVKVKHQIYNNVLASFCHVHDRNVCFLLNSPFLRILTSFYGGAAPPCAISAPWECN
jgi:hypothetical protein